MDGGGAWSVASALWSSYKLSKDEIEHLQQSFSKMLVMPESLLDESHQKWE